MRDAAPTPYWRTLYVGAFVVLFALAVVPALAFVGHLSSGMTLQWENLMALCGFS